MAQQDENCLFCKIVADEIPATVIYRNERVVIFHDIQPQAPIHWLAISTQHTRCVSETPDDQLFADVLGTVRDVAKQQGLTDFRLVFNNGEGAGQTVMHMHLHLLAGRSLGWPPG